MNIDLSKLQKGDTVHFRSGGEVIIENMLESDVLIGIKWGADTVSFYSKNGMKACVTESDSDWHASSNHCPFDIIRITPAELDWSTVKPGMAFESQPSGHDEMEMIVWYIGPYWMDDSFVVITQSNGVMSSDDIYFNQKSWLTRAPEHDI